MPEIDPVVGLSVAIAAPNASVFVRSRAEVREGIAGSGGRTSRTSRGRRRAWRAGGGSGRRRRQSASQR